MTQPDAGLVDVLGDVLLVGMTVVLAGGLAMLLSTQVQPPSPASLDLSITSSPGELRLHHAGGEELDANATDAVLAVEGTQHRVALSDCPSSGGDEPFTLEPGEQVTFVDAAPRCEGLPSGEVSELTVTVDPPGADPRVVASWTGSVQAG